MSNTRFYVTFVFDEAGDVHLLKSDKETHVALVNSSDELTQFVGFEYTNLTSVLHRIIPFVELDVVSDIIAKPVICNFSPESVTAFVQAFRRCPSVSRTMSSYLMVHQPYARFDDFLRIAHKGI